MSNELFNAFIKWWAEECEYWPAHNAHPMEVEELIELVRESLEDYDDDYGDNTTKREALNYFIDQYDSLTQS